MANKPIIDKVANFFGFTRSSKEAALAVIQQKDPLAPPPKNLVPPEGRRQSSPDEVNAFFWLEKEAEVIKPGYQFEVIPFIRKLTIANADVSQALHNIVHLGNTGHLIKFDTGVSNEDADKMRKHIETVATTWLDGATGTHAIANKLFRQCMISGANSFEPVPNLPLTGIYKLILVSPETIRFKYNRRKITYEPYQYVKNGILKNGKLENLKKLNPNTYKYFALNGDTESPYANPPYLPALGPIEDQKVMLENIKFIIRQIGVVGFLQLLMDKPDQLDGESEDKYKTRCSAFLQQAKDRIEESMRDGVIVGFEGDHSFTFESISKNLSGVETLFGINETQVASGLKSDPGLMGKGSKGAESHITIIFTKLIAELSNIQINVASCLQFLYNMELRLAGFKFETLKVEFNPSTVQDDLKMQQAREIKIRNLMALYAAGIISQDKFAEELGYEKPDEQEPRVPLVMDDDPTGTEEKRVKREKGKDTSDRKSRAKDKPQDKKAYK